VSEVLVVGAGPTGLTLAAQLHARGVDLRIVERRRERGPSRAFLVHPRTLELVAPLGLADALLARGDPNARVRLHAGHRTAEVGFAQPNLDDTPFPRLLTIPQSAVEETLEAHLERVGVEVERGVELIGVTPTPDGVDHELHRHRGGTSRGRSRYVVGCDGADSTVRDSVGIPFPMRTYRSAVLLADLDVDGALDPDSLHGFVAGPGVLFLFPSPTGPGWRLLVVSPDPADVPSGDELVRGDGLPRLQAVVDRFTRGSLQLHPPTWAERVPLRRGQAASYRQGRVFLAGDAAHLHSPAGGQGMNTGMHDATNLAWKLAMVVAGAATDRLLDSYEAERWPVARRTRQLTDVGFVLEAADHRPLPLLRRYALPPVLPLASGRTMPPPAFRLLAGLTTRYRRSPIVEDGAPKLRRGPHAGDRMPDGLVRDAAGGLGWLSTVFDRPDHHLLMCSRREPIAASGRSIEGPIPVHVRHLTTGPSEGASIDPDGRLLDRLGVTDEAVYLVRPDGYIAYRAAGSGLAGVTRYLDRLHHDGVIT
jgi:2-polyprenyl-6-methoxyphenol hydroxylase-like FAD-dependent oxidoreductase